MITLLNLNAKASDIYNKVILDPDGDYKFIAYPDTQYYEIYNLSVTGLLSAIVCGLSASFDIDGISLPVDIDIFDNTINITSIDDQSGAYVPALSASLFAALFNNDYVYLFYSGVSLYLLSGIY